MKYVIPVLDLRMALADGFGPLTYESNRLLEQIHKTWTPGQPHSEISLHPAKPTRKFRPRFFEIGYPGCVCVSIDIVKDGTLDFLSNCVIAKATIGKYGTFVVFDYDSVENEFTQVIYFSASEFSEVCAVSMRDVWELTIITQISRINSKEELENCRSGLFPLDVIVGNRIVLKNDWPADFFVFDGNLYVSDELDLTDSGLVSSKNECDVDVIPSES